MSQYDDAFFKGAEDAFGAAGTGRRSAAAERRLLERLVPDPVFRREMQGFFDAHPRLQRQFPGGVVQFAQMAGDMPEDVLQDMMVALQEGNEEEEREGGMPGEFPDVLLHFEEPGAEGEGEEAEAEQEDVGAHDEGGRFEHEDREEEGDEDEDDDEEDDEGEELAVRLSFSLFFLSQHSSYPSSPGPCAPCATSWGASGQPAPPARTPTRQAKTETEAARGGRDKPATTT